MEHLAAASASARRGGKGRLLGVDAARALALIGMMAVHVLPSTRPTGDAHWYYLIAGGRSSALFAVLAGLGLALASGGANPLAGRERWAASAATVTRAAVLGVIGLFLGGLSSGVAVILVHYGLLFLIGALVIGLRSPTLITLASLWAVGAPALSHIWRMGGQPNPKVPQPSSLLDPLAMVGDVFLTGYYPVLTWITYLLAGLAVGRLALGTSSTATGVLGVGVALAVGARLLSAYLLGPLGGSEEVGDLPVQYFGTAPTDSWWFLAIPTPHSGSPIDLIHTTGTALAIIGLCLLIARLGRHAVAWLTGAGGMTLTIYTAHVIVLSGQRDVESRLALFSWHVSVALLIGLLWRLLVGRGPLETLTANMAAGARSAVSSGGITASTSTRG